MDICCNVYTLPDLSTFYFKCTKCHYEFIKDWLEFVEHLRNCRKAIILEAFDEQPYVYDGSDIKLPVLEVIEPKLNEEERTDNLNLENAQDDGTDSMKHEADDGELDKNKIDENNDTNGDDFDEDDYQPEISSDDTTSDEEYACKKSAIKFSPSFYRRNKCTTAFIDLYKEYPCLWDTHHTDYKDEEAQKEAYDAMIAKIEKEFKIKLTQRTIKRLISRIRQQYYTTQEDMKSKRKSKLKSLALEHFKKCSFLGTIDGEDSDSLPMESSSVGFKNKFLIFSRLSKPATETFIDLYGHHSILYDRNHIDYGSNPKRKSAFNSISEALNKKHNISLNTEELYKHVRSLRQWYYSTCERKNNKRKLSDEEQKYLEQCSFLPVKKKKQKLACEHCDNFSTSETTLQLHMYEVHKIGEMPHKCEECDRTFRQRSSLQLHIQRSHSDKKLECEYCHRRFSVIADYRLHIRTHTEEKPYVCELCGKAFRIRTQLGYHITAIHTKVRAFKCTMCPKDFLKQVHLKDHIKSHLNIRDKICETCGKGFTNCHSLIRHRQIHAEVKKFECKVCDAKFHQFVGLNSHMKRRHDIVKEKPRY